MLFLRTERGIDIKGDAWTIQPNLPKTAASEGDVLLTFEGPGHAAEIIGFEGSVEENGYNRPEYFVVMEANYTRCKVGTRRIAWNDPEIKGVYHPLSTP